MESTEHSCEIAALVAAHRKGYALAQPFYLSDTVFARDLQAFFFQEWQLAGHISEIPQEGDYLLFEMMNESIIIVRGKNNAIHALANVCRHRGSRVCIEPRGNTKRFTCPYHAWAFNLDGSLFNARMLDADHDRSKLGLKPVAVEVFQGLIYVSLSPSPTSFERLRADLDPILAPFGLARTKIAYRESYPVRANWKLLVENYNECYHCTAAHPEFARSHATHMDAARVAPLNAQMQARSKAAGASTAYFDCIGAKRPSGSPDYAYNRYSLFDGFLTGSEDGTPLAPLLGDLTAYDSGASDVYVGILNPMLVYCDHALIYRFVPIDKDTSVQEIIWLVHEDAQEGTDYDLDRLKWLWDVTTVADKRIIEKNQEGVNSRFYEPGPFVGMEAYTQRFIEAYLATLATS
ncbi:MAG: aromatic ring-hydroxylating dioxygenase subunit alpha [Yoonia sp.]|uniref:aromatic ring-hydroxylating oxygenase subunit alpha n=1 Tax=Yoonia sp. TaxID=2212373 RepID=UPI00273ED154|nr:aromatic ring-hydroxylating dioxygenase subunit alpha [Yoonia sp.]MDP5085209.1 aromatic ring-hydroxylating dioxygenase subunit alpha [Yoonia sp.]